MDLQLPTMDGFEATRRIRLLYGGNTPPVIAMTANAMRGDRERSLEAGMNDHVTKPIDQQHLFATLRKWIASGSESESGPVSAPVRVAAFDGGELKLKMEEFKALLECNSIEAEGVLDEISADLQQRGLDEEAERTRQALMRFDFNAARESAAALFERFG